MSLPGVINHFSKCLYQVRSKTVVIHSFDVFELWILPFDEELSVLNSLEFGICVIFTFFHAKTDFNINHYQFTYMILLLWKCNNSPNWLIKSFEKQCIRQMKWIEFEWWCEIKVIYTKFEKTKQHNYAFKKRRKIPKGYSNS